MARKASRKRSRPKSLRKRNNRTEASAPGESAHGAGESPTPGYNNAEDADSSTSSKAIPPTSFRGRRGGASTGGDAGSALTPTSSDGGRGGGGASTLTQSTSLADAMDDQNQIAQDIGSYLVPHLNNHLFYHVIHIYKDMEEELMAQSGKLCKSFVKKCLTQLDSNVNFQNSNEKDRETYLKHLWTTAYNNKTITETMNMRRTGIYGSIRTRFLRLVEKCVTNQVPIPAPETLTDRSRIPGRYFLFYDELYRGCFINHTKSSFKVNTANNKRRRRKRSSTEDPWGKAIKGGETDRFGTRMVEAHALTILEKNYFKWIFDLASQLVGIAHGDFKLEYEVADDLDNLFERKKTIDFYNNLSPAQISCNTEEETDGSGLATTYNLILQEEEEELERASKIQQDRIKYVVQEAADKRQDQIQKFRKALEDSADSRRKEPNDNEDQENEEAEDDDNIMMERMKKKLMKDLITFRSGDGKRNRDSNSSKLPPGNRITRSERAHFLKVKARLVAEEKSGIRLAWEQFYRQLMQQKEQRQKEKSNYYEQETEKIDVDDYLDELDDDEIEQV